MKHNRKGNCWDAATCYGRCRECRDELCDVCHVHCEPRGECRSCPPCEPCSLADVGECLEQAVEDTKDLRREILSAEDLPQGLMQMVLK